MTKVNEMFALQITDSSFEKEVINGSGPVLVDFWAEWCGPCHTIAPVLEELAEEYQGRLRVVKVNVDENPETPARFGVRGIPTLMLFEDGEPQETVVGVQPKSRLVGLLDPYVN